MPYFYPLIITSVLLFPAFSTASQMERNSTQLARQFHEAHSAGNYAKIEKLIYWKGVEEKNRLEVEKVIKNNFRLKIRRCYATSSPSIFSNNSFRLEKKTYRPNLKPLGRLQIDFDTSNDQSMSYIIGKKNDKYFIVLNAPK